jgi:hypothetical protein
MIILFVVPDTMEAAFVTQKITGAKKMGHWDKKTAQYVLGGIRKRGVPSNVVMLLLQ